jgi:hypothetical protein
LIELFGRLEPAKYLEPGMGSVFIAPEKSLSKPETYHETLAETSVHQNFFSRKYRYQFGSIRRVLPGGEEDEPIMKRKRRSSDNNP